ncbi:MAG: DUF86 domain-containing protein [Pseudomonadota bacterium]
MKERISQKIGKIREYLSLVEQLAPDCGKKFLPDPIYRGALLHYLYLMADTCIALAEQVIRLHSLRQPQSYHEAFDILGNAAILDPQFAYSFARIAGFRNFLAHDYEEIKASIICNDILKQLPEVKEFLSQIEKTV